MMMIRDIVSNWKPQVAAAFAVCAALIASPGLAQVNWDEVEIEVTDLGGAVHMLKGRGGNIGACVGPDGAFLVDDQFAPLTEKIQAAVAQLGGEPIRFVINTHFHGDHTGGNENLGGAGAWIVAHDNVRKRMSTTSFSKAFNRLREPVNPAALPVVTFDQSVTFHLNGEEIHVLHVKRAHTDGDSFVYFKNANVLHMGDVFFNGMYPFIDVSAGGTVDGLIAAVDHALDSIDDTTKIIPGHGPITDREGLAQYRTMLQEIRDKVEPLVMRGKSLEEVQAAKPTASYDATWGNGFIKPDKLVELIYDSLDN